MAVVGAYGPLFSAVTFGDAVTKGLALRMNQAPVNGQWPRLLEHIRAGHLRPSDIVTHRIPLGHIAEGYHLFSAKLDGCIKTLVTTDATLQEAGDMTYRAQKPPLPETADQLRARVPGWGTDLDPADRPSVPQELGPGHVVDPSAVPEQHPETVPRERSIQHARLTPVFGMACPPAGVPGLIRRHAYARYSEARAAHWLLLIAADRVDAFGSTVRSFATLRPDNPVTETGVLGARVDRPHHLLDPLVVSAPWLLAGAAVVTVVRRGARRARAPRP